MRLNNFSVRVPEGTEIAGGYVEINHGTQYTLRLRNGWYSRKCDAKVMIDGKHVGTWRIPSGESIVIERPVHDTGRFTYYKSGTKDAKDAGLNSVDADDLGLIQVVFTPEKQFYWYTYPAPAVLPPNPTYVYYTDSTYKPSSSTSSNTVTTRSSTVRRASVDWSNAKRLSSGGTGLSGESDQHFGVANSIEHDHSTETTISLRLVSRSHGNEPRPLTQFSTPVPPAV